MAQATVTPITKQERHKHADSMILALVTRWRLCRREAQLHWAKYEYDTVYYTDDDAPDATAPSKSLEMMGETESIISDFSPATTLGAKLMLEMALEILAEQQRDPDSTLARGPVVDLLHNVRSALSLRDIELS